MSDTTEKFFPNDKYHAERLGCVMGLRAAFAWDLIRAHPNVAGTTDGEDSAGRAKIRLQSSQELVDRSFEIADLFVSKALERGEILKKVPEEEEAKAAA